MSAKTSAPRYAAKASPLRPQTVWSLEDDALVETTGARIRRRPLAALRSFAVVGEAGSGRRAAHLHFAGARVIIPAQSLAGARLEDRSAAFDAFVGALQDAWGGRPGRADSGPRGPRRLADGLVWGIGLTAAGALAMILAALLSGLGGLGLALGARLLFVAVLLCAALPWLGRRPGD